MISKSIAATLFVIPFVLIAQTHFGPSLSQGGIAYAQGGICDENTQTDCVDWEQRIAFAIGMGAPAEWANSEAQKNISAQRAARVDAARNLLELIKGINVSSETSMAQAMVADDKVTSHVRGRLAGVRVVGEPKYFSDGSIAVRVAGRLQEIVPTELYISGPPRQLGPPTSGGAIRINTQRIYTGLIIDAKGTGVLPAMSPKVLDPEGREVYGSAYVSRDFAVSQGIVGYAKEVSAARQNDRVQGNPLVIKALESKGANKADLVVSQADADALRQIAQSQNFMRESRVMIVLD